jgi:hypothetical protein
MRTLARALGAGDRARMAIRIGFLALSLAAIAWDLPSSFSWENDGVAPRDIFAGVAQNLKPGSAFRYPLLHPLLLGVLCLPVLLPAALRAPSFRLVDLQPAMLATPVMTACALIGRAVSIAASLVALAALGRIATRLAGRRVSLWAEAFAVANFSFAYYGRATNLDGPALMWTALSVERLLRAGEAGDARDLTAGAIFAALAVATKDQSYATFVLVLPLVAIGFARAREARGSVWVAQLARAGAMATLVYGAASGALLNPSGFVTRLRTLGGPASGDYRAYTRDVTGIMANLHDLAAGPARLWWPWPVVALAWMGVALAIAHVVVGGEGNQRRRKQLGLLGPLAAGAGSLVVFTLVVGRTDHRFVLPLGFWLSFYAGVAFETAIAQAAARSESLRAAVAGAGTLLLASSFVAPVELCATQWADGRRAVERWLEARSPGTTVETYGPLVYQPRFAKAAAQGLRITRVGPAPVAGRNPQTGMDERQGRIADVLSRSPDVVLITEGFAGAFLDEPTGAGHSIPEVARRERADAATMAVVRAAVAGALPSYRLCFVAEPRLPAPLVAQSIHLSVGQRAWVLARTDGLAADCGTTN